MFILFAGVAGFALTASAQQATRLDPSGPLTPALARQLGQNVTNRVIVLMKNRQADADRARLLNDLQIVKPRPVKTLALVSAFAATVSNDEITRLKANPSVGMVIADAPIRAPRHASHHSSAKLSPFTGGPSLNVIPGACSAGSPLLEPEALQTTNTDSLTPNAQTARSLGYDGAGVKVAWIADGIDPGNINFIRPDGKSVFDSSIGGAYQDFSGDGPSAPTSGDEAFLDANAVAGQGLNVYNVASFSAQTYPTACNIRIEGVAPGAALVGLKVFNSFGSATTSSFLQAIDYAVLTARVDIINESFGSNEFPAQSSLDAIAQFDEAAVAAGVTVVVSSGDAGPTDTIGSPASDPAVISVGASTTFRFYAQTNYAAARYFATGWLNDNISSLSSGGFTQNGRTIDLVAPGDLGFASCDASANFDGCGNFLGQLSNVEESGGTSLSSPLTAGAAALVIQAYRKGHRGASPAPALIKQILASTATDLSVPSSLQGAGLLNAYKAVEVAQSTLATEGLQPCGCDALLFSTNQLDAVALPGSVVDWPVTVTNTGNAPQMVNVYGRTQSAPEHVQTGSVTLNDGSSPQFVGYSGLTNNYATFQFAVANGENLLSAAIAYPGNPQNGGNARVRLILIDPLGRLAGHSLPQGVGNFGNVEVRAPTPGNWTGVIFSDIASYGGTNGTVPWQVSTQRFTGFGQVTPSQFELYPGQSKKLSFVATTPPTPGDYSGSIVFTSNRAGVDGYLGPESNTIPVSLRSLVNVAGGGNFSGALTGGNGRAPGEGQAQYFEFNVGSGVTNIAASVKLTNDPQDAVGAYLVGPDGVARGFGQNSGPSGATLALAAYVLNPPAGLWTLVLDFPGPVVGNEVSQPFSGTIQFNMPVAAVGPIPYGAALPAGVPLTVPVSITNNGVAPGLFFIDARLNSTATQALSIGNSTVSLPLSGGEPFWLVPTQTSSLQISAFASIPVEFDYGPTQGDPDLFGAPSGPTTAAGAYIPTGGTAQPGLWFAAPTDIGPYPVGAPAGTATMNVSVVSKAFDGTVTSSTGDCWLLALNVAGACSPVWINPGQTRAINVTITPSGLPNTTVIGSLYVDTFDFNLPPYGTDTGNELAAIPYSYTVRGVGGCVVAQGGRPSC